MTFHYEVVQASVLQLAAYRLCLGYATPNLHVFHFMYIYIYIYIYFKKTLCCMWYLHQIGGQQPQNPPHITHEVLRNEDLMDCKFPKNHRCAQQNKGK